MSELDPNKYELHYYETKNEQYKLDSNLHPDLFEKEIKYQFDKDYSEWFEPFIYNIEFLLNEHNIEKNKMVHLGVSMGRVSFQLAKHFKEVYGLDYCSKYLKIAKDLQRDKKIKIALNNEIIKYNIENQANTSNVLLKQITWIPNEIPMSDFVLLTMIDRLTLPLAWLRRFKEIVKPNGLLVIYSENSRYNGKNLSSLLKEFELIKENSVTTKDSFTVWKIKP